METSLAPYGQLECRSRPTGFVEILFWGGVGGSWRHFTSEGVTIFCRVKEELKLEDSKQCPGSSVRCVGTGKVRQVFRNCDA